MAGPYDKDEKRYEGGDLGVHASPNTTATYADSLDEEEFALHKLGELRGKNRRRRCLPRISLAAAVCYLSILAVFFSVSFLAGVKYSQSWPEVGAWKKAYCG